MDGFSLDEIAHTFPEYTDKNLRSLLLAMQEDGLLYTTIDEHHYVPTSEESVNLMRQQEEFRAALRQQLGASLWCNLSVPYLVSIVLDFAAPRPANMFAFPPDISDRARTILRDFGGRRVESSKRLRRR